VNQADLGSSLGFDIWNVSRHQQVRAGGVVNHQTHGPEAVSINVDPPPPTYSTAHLIFPSQQKPSFYLSSYAHLLGRPL
jgi:hypothetical protein